MNIKEYISSGIIESYVLGLASEEDRLDFESQCRRYPELVAARNDFELALEKIYMREFTVPVLGVKERILDEIRMDSTGTQTKIITMDSNRTSSSFKWLAAAAVILLIVSAYFAYDFYNRNKTLETELARSKELQKEMDGKLKQMEMVSDPNVAVVNLKGTEKSPKSSASVYWDSTSTNVYLVVKNMPKLASEKQYQLWALIDGQPKDLGLFDVGDDKKIFLKMNNTQKADAFAITIEPRGNTGGPTGELQTMGKTSL